MRLFLRGSPRGGVIFVEDEEEVRGARGVQMLSIITGNTNKNYILYLYY
jgi:hypothetical protein